MVVVVGAIVVVVVGAIVVVVVGAIVVVVVGATVVVVVGATVVVVVCRGRRVVVVGATVVVVVGATVVVVVVVADVIVVDGARVVGGLTVLDVTVAGVVTTVVVPGVDRVPVVVPVVVPGPVPLVVPGPLGVSSTTTAGARASVVVTGRTSGRVLESGIVVVGAGPTALSDSDSAAWDEVVTRSVDATAPASSGPFPSGSTVFTTAGAEELPTTSMSTTEASPLESGPAVLVRAAKIPPRVALDPTAANMTAAAQRRRGRRMEATGRAGEPVRDDRTAKSPGARRRPSDDRSITEAPPPSASAASTASVSTMVDMDEPAPSVSAPADPETPTTAPPERDALMALR